MTDLTNQWYQAIRISPIESDDEVTTASTAQLNINLSAENQTHVHGKKSKRRPSHGSILSI